LQLQQWNSLWRKFCALWMCQACQGWGTFSSAAPRQRGNSFIWPCKNKA
jgi:hypothetical protein